MFITFSKFPDYLSYFMKVVLIGIFLYEIFSHNILLALGALSALVLSSLPAIVSRNYQAHLPVTVDFFVTLSVFLHIFGLAFNFYHSPTWWWWDNLTHFLGVGVIAMLAFLLIFSLTYVKKIHMPLSIAGIFIFSSAMAIGALWEVSEFYFDIVFGTESLGDLYDTIEDLQFNAVGGLVVTVFGVLYMKRKFKKKPL